MSNRKRLQKQQVSFNDGQMIERSRRKLSHPFVIMGNREKADTIEKNGEKRENTEIDVGSKRKEGS